MSPVPFASLSLRLQQTNDLLLHLPDADFVAIDEEMTGIQLPHSGRPRKEQPPSERYAAQKLVPERYSIIQLGIALHKGRQVRRYNFYAFPASDSSREIVMNPSAVHFLNQHHMSFDVWTKHGIHFCNEDHATAALERFLDDERRAQQAEMGDRAAGASPPTVADAVSRTIELRRTEDIDFFARTMAGLREWLDSAAPPTSAADEDALHTTTGRQFLLPACNSFLRRALYENIAKEYPNLILEKVEPNDESNHNINNNNAGNHNAAAPPYQHQQIRVLRLSPDELRARRQRMRYDRWSQLITDRIGLWRVVSALRHVCHGRPLDRTHPLWAASPDPIDWATAAATVGFGTVSDVAPVLRRRVPLVVHNGWMDLLFLMTHFDSRCLPDALSDCKALVRSYFPIIFDTKVLSIEYCGYAQMNLATLFRTVGDPGLQVVSSGADPIGDALGSTEHEAAYDAYMTGAVFVGLSRHLKPVTVPGDDSDGEVVDDDNNDQSAAAGGRQCPSHWYDATLGRNRIYSLGLFTLDLENPESDPLSRGMLPEAAYLVSGIDPSVTTRDIVWCLHELVDSDRRPVNFDIVWVDDTTFIVACRYRPTNVDTVGLLAASTDDDHDNKPDDSPDETILKAHGQLIQRALSVRFGRDGIVSLGEHFRRSRAAAEALRRPNWFARVLALTSFRRPVKSKRKSAGEERDSPGAAKRQRRS